MNYTKISIDPGIEYIMDWKDQNGGYKIEQYLPYGKTVLNKKITGCGITSWCLYNFDPIILVSPRVRLCQNKLEQLNKNSRPCYYFNREHDEKGREKKDIPTLIKEMYDYQAQCCLQKSPMKLLVTYDSFATFTDILEREFNLNINNFRIVVDEAQCIVKDVCIKEYNNNNVLSNFLRHVFQYQNILFVSATPLINYLAQIDEFKQNQVDYIELEWPNITPITQMAENCVNSMDAFDRIYDHYSKHTDSSGRHVFDTIFSADEAMYSYECCIFLNSVRDICKILKKYVVEMKLINIGDVSVICANTKDNNDRLHTIDKNLHVANRIPLYGEQHPIFTFVTRTCFDGCDFNSMSATTYVIANYNIKSLQLDIATDIPQIIGRQRVKTNVFRNTIHIFFTGNKRNISDMEYSANRNERIRETEAQLSIWGTTLPEYKDIALSNLNKLIERQPGTLYIKTTNGVPEINNLIMLSEDYCRDIVTTHTLGYIMQHSPQSSPTYSPFTTQLKNQLNSVSGAKKIQDRLRIIGTTADNAPASLVNEIYQMLHNEGYNNIAYYLYNLPIAQMAALGYDTWKIQQTIDTNKLAQGIMPFIKQSFISGQWFDKQTIKEKLQRIYDQLGMTKCAKATDLPNLINCRESKQNGIKGYVIL